jgi:hypothetical protein
MSEQDQDSPQAPEVPTYRDSDIAPFIYFDAVGAMGTIAGTVQIELASRVLRPEGDGVKMEFMTTGRLRCSPLAAQHLREAIDKSLAMLAQPPQSAPPVAPGRLN